MNPSRLAWEEVVEDEATRARPSYVGEEVTTIAPEPRASYVAKSELGQVRQSRASFASIPPRSRVPSIRKIGDSAPPAALAALQAPPQVARPSFVAQEERESVTTFAVRPSLVAGHEIAYDKTCLAPVASENTKDFDALKSYLFDDMESTSEDLAELVQSPVAFDSALDREEREEEEEAATSIIALPEYEEEEQYATDYAAAAAAAPEEEQEQEPEQFVSPLMIPPPAPVEHTAPLHVSQVASAMDVMRARRSFMNHQAMTPVHTPIPSSRPGPSSIPPAVDSINAGSWVIPTSPNSSRTDSTARRLQHAEPFRFTLTTAALMLTGLAALAVVVVAIVFVRTDISETRATATLQAPTPAAEFPPPPPVSTPAPSAPTMIVIGEAATPAAVAPPPKPVTTPAAAPKAAEPTPAAHAPAVVVVKTPVAVKAPVAKKASKEPKALPPGADKSVEDMLATLRAEQLTLSGSK